MHRHSAVPQSDHLIMPFFLSVLTLTHAASNTRTYRQACSNIFPMEQEEEVTLEVRNWSQACGLLDQKTHRAVQQEKPTVEVSLREH